jgi:hypothetical protein
MFIILLRFLSGQRSLGPDKHHHQLLRHQVFKTSISSELSNAAFQRAKASKSYITSVRANFTARPAAGVGEKKQSQ